MTPEEQIQWLLDYIKGRYGNPVSAWRRTLATNWYDQGGVLPPGLTMTLNTALNIDEYRWRPGDEP